MDKQCKESLEIHTNSEEYTMITPNCRNGGGEHCEWYIDRLSSHLSKWSEITDSREILENEFKLPSTETSE